ncbi:hypothetical protein D3C76_1019080 [compost metagenome]
MAGHDKQREQGYLHDQHLCRRFHKIATQSFVIDQRQYATRQYFINAVIGIDDDMGIIHDSIGCDGDGKKRDQHHPPFPHHDYQQGDGHIKLDLHAQAP